MKGGEGYLWWYLSRYGWRVVNDLVCGMLQCYVHDSMEPATERSATTMVSIEREVMVQILPSIRNATPALRSVTPERRRCLFDDEYPQYPVASGYENCLINCEGDRIWKTCGCRPLTLPHVAGGRGLLCPPPPLSKHKS